MIGLRGADAVDARDAGHDDDIPSLQEGVGRRVAELVDRVIDRGVFLDVGVRAGDVGFRLVIVVITYEVLDGVLREEHLELPIELGGEGLVVGDDQGGPVHGGDDIRHREGLSGTGHPKKDLVLASPLQTRDELFDGLRLIPPRLIIADQMKRPHALSPQMMHPGTIPRG